MLKIPLAELERRIVSLQALMKEDDLESVILLQGADLYYYAGVFQTGLLWIPRAGDPIFFVRRNYDQARQLSPLNTIEAVKSLRQIPQLLAGKNIQVAGKAGVEADVLPVEQHKLLCDLFPEASFHDASPLIRRQRSCKSEFEIGVIRRAAAMMDLAYQELIPYLRLGMTELEVAAQLEYILRLRKHQGVIRVRGMHSEFHYGCVLAGKHGSEPSFFDSATGGHGLNPSYPKGSSENRLERNMPLLIDYVGCCDGYCADTTIVFAWGMLPAPLPQAHRTVLAIQNAIVQKARPGVLCDELYLLARQKAEAAGLASYFMGYDSGQVKFVGHGIGIELNELPVLTTGSQVPLVPGMTIALEPKFVFPDLGTIGTESTFLMTEHGLERLNQFPTEIVYLT